MHLKEFQDLIRHVKTALRTGGGLVIQRNLFGDIEDRSLLRLQDDEGLLNETNLEQRRV